MEVEEQEEEEEKKTSLQAEQESRVSSDGLLDSSYERSCHGDILHDRLLLTGASLCLGFPQGSKFVF